MILCPGGEALLYGFITWIGTICGNHQIDNINLVEYAQNHPISLMGIYIRNLINMSLWSLEIEHR